MTAPAQDAPEWGPATITVPLSPCCGALPGDWCGCAVDAAETAAALAAPIGPYEWTRQVTR